MKSLFAGHGEQGRHRGFPRLDGRRQTDPGREDLHGGRSEAGNEIRVTLQNDAPHAAIRVEAIEKNPEFASL